MLINEGGKQFVIYFKNSIILQIVLSVMTANLMFIRNFSIFSLILMFGVNIIGLGLNNDSDKKSYSISVVYILVILMIFIFYFSINGFSLYGKWLSLPIPEIKKEIRFLIETLYVSFGIIWTLSLSIFGIKIFIYCTIKIKENTNFYAGLLISSTIIFMYIFERISRESNNWSYFIAIGSFFLLLFDYNNFVSAFSKCSKNELNSKHGKKLTFNIKKKFARIKLIISASSIIAIVSVIFNAPGAWLYEIAIKSIINKKPMPYDKFGILLYTFIFIMTLFCFSMFIFYTAKGYKVRCVMKQMKLEGKENQKTIWNKTWRIRNSMKRIPFLEDIVEFYEFISTDTQKRAD